MTSLGDLNRDGFRDIAIGAPYEDRGAIYIFLGTEDGITEKPSQVTFTNTSFWDFIGYFNSQ